MSRLIIENISGIYADVICKRGGLFGRVVGANQSCSQHENEIHYQQKIFCEHDAALQSSKFAILKISSRQAIDNDFQLQFNRAQRHPKILARAFLDFFGSRSRFPLRFDGARK